MICQFLIIKQNKKSDEFITSFQHSVVHECCPMNFYGVSLWHSIFLAIHECVMDELSLLLFLFLFPFLFFYLRWRRQKFYWNEVKEVLRSMYGFGYKLFPIIDLTLRILISLHWKITTRATTPVTSKQAICHTQAKSWWLIFPF